ncbi:MAG: bifunctional sugar-1-phosphate nucleotidylyltransferase/acetyltransferase [Methanomassiliicoccales archaeon]
MKALILAAGEGTRLRPLTSNIPKPMLTVAGKPFISHQVEALISLGIREFVVLVGWKSNRVKEFLLEEYPEVDMEFLEQGERLGTAHAIGRARETMDRPFLCLNGDLVLSREDLSALMDVHRRTGEPVMGAVNVEYPRRFGVLDLEGERLSRIVEKPSDPPSHLVNAGVMLLTPEVFDAIDRTPRSVRGEYEITDTLNSIAPGVLVHRLTGDWMDVAHPWELLEANRMLMSRLSSSVTGEVEEGAHLHGQVLVEEGARVRSGSYIEGPVHIASGCDIGPNAYLRPNTCLGRRVRVGAASEVKNSIVLCDTRIPHHNYVGDSVLGERCNLGSGTKVANLRFDGLTVQVMESGRPMDTGRRKLGAIMGDDVSTGINSMIDVGTVVFENSIIGPGARASGTISPGSMIL